MDFNIFMNAEELAAAAQSCRFPSVAEILLFLIGTGFFLFLNAFFVANEFASARVRASQLEEDDDDTPKEAKRRRAARHIVRNLDTYLSANQVGITLASLALGGLSEPFIEHLLEWPLKMGLHLNDAVVSVVSYFVAFCLFTFMHVVLGELVPKSLAIRHPLEIAMHTAPWMHRFAASTSLIVRLFNNTANGIAHRVFGVDPHYVPNDSHSAEEIALIVEASGRTNEVTETEAEISKNALELNDRAVYDIMVPRTAVEVLDLEDSFEENLKKVTNSRHSRFPLVVDHLDNVKGWLHVKDVLRMVQQQERDLNRIHRELKVVPDTMKLDTLLEFFSKEHTHLALVVDEYGDAQGLVFLDDLLEEIVGDDIRDEFESEEARDFFRIGEGQYIASGSIALFDLEEALPELGEPECESDVSTLGGYITATLGHMPKCDEQVRIKDFLVTVTGSDGRRVTQTRIEYAPLPKEAE